MNIKILIIEPSADELESFYSNIFEKLNYKCSFIKQTNELDDSDYNKYDILITDISYGKTGDDHGLKLASLIKNDFPNLFIIANTREYNSLNLSKITQNLPEPDLLLNKARFMEEEYQNYVFEKIKDNFKSNVSLTVDKNNSTLSTLLNDNYSDLESIIKKITFSTHNVESETIINKAQLKPLVNGYSGSEVYKMSLFTQNNLSCINTVLKITNNIKNAQQEIDNYLKYVKWYLPYSWRPELIGYNSSKTLGAICYSFAYDNEKDFKSLTEYLNENKFDKLSLAIDKIFKPNLQRWYHSNNVLHLNKKESLMNYYYKKWFDKREHDDSILLNIVIRLPNEEQELVTHTDISKYLFGNLKYNGYSTCICHGDLNSNNILISEDNQLTFIDFMDTNRGHVFEDFVTLEGSIRVNMNLQLDFKQNIQVEKMINSNIDIHSNEEIINNFEQNILKMRQYAFETFNEDQNYYYYSLALFCFRLLRIDDFELWQQKQIIACMVASLQKIYCND